MVAVRGWTPDKNGHDSDEKAKAERLKRKLQEQREKRERELRERKAKEEAERKAKEAKPEPKAEAEAEAEPVKPEAPTTAPPVVMPPGALKRTTELLEAGGFTRSLSWRERRAVRRIEKSARVLRRELLRAFPASTPFVTQSCDSLAHIEVASRLELLTEKKAS